MRWSEAFIPTLREAPKDAITISHRLLLRGGFIKQIASGIHTYLPLGWRVIKKIMSIIREEMDRIGGQELHMPALTPAELWEETGRWKEYGDEMFRVKDRKKRDYALAPTHEEIITEIARKEIRSYRDLPQIWYQIQMKFRDEIRPRGGVLRARAFLMKDSYSLDRDWDGLGRSYELHYEAYKRIFERCKLPTVVVEASGGIMGGSESHEFMILSDTGEDSLVICSCGYSANTEIGEAEPIPVDFKDGELKKVHTPVEGTVENITKFLEIPHFYLMKSLMYVHEGRPIFVVIRGDYDVDERKLENVFPGIRPAHPDEIKEWTGAPPGYISPVGLDIPVYADVSLKGGKGLTSGANEEFYHLTGIDIERDVKVKEWIDVRMVKTGDRCKRCGKEIEVRRAIELGHIFKLGTKYSNAMHATFLDRDGKEKPIVMGSYGIGVERIMASAIEVYHDDNGIIWPITIAPYEVAILSLNPSNPDVKKTAEDVYKELMDVDVIYDDRDEQPGVKFKDSDLIGTPIRIVVGERGIKRGVVEVKKRKDDEIFDVEPGKVKEVIMKIRKELYGH